MKNQDDVHASSQEVLQVGCCLAEFELTGRLTKAFLKFALREKQHMSTASNFFVINAQSAAYCQG